MPRSPNKQRTWIDIYDLAYQRGEDLAYCHYLADEWQKRQDRKQRAQVEQQPSKQEQH